MATSCFMVWSGKIQVISSQCSHVSDTLSTAVGVEMSTPICMSVCLHTRYDRCWLTGTSPAHQGRASEGWRWAWGEKKKKGGEKQRGWMPRETESTREWVVCRMPSSTLIERCCVVLIHHCSAKPLHPVSYQNASLGITVLYRPPTRLF